MEAEQRETIIAELKEIHSSTSSLVKSLRLLVEFTDPEKGELTQAQDKVSESLSVWKTLFSAAAQSPASSP
ncbi:hypothetical protein AB205_0090750 [Aquarana catesbeiana]|uniref:Uncharacterized protein n=1 Tax=Aquarana catesbeiana TaxID=8400 RepID=A0A2G9RZ67_AQUCT|nr:hypothetical protein AB205_0090750 [Aquarana catesbeiana]